MKKIFCIFKHSIDDKKGIRPQAITNINIIEEEGKYPIATIYIDKNYSDKIDYQNLCNCVFCDITNDDILLFKGKISDVVCKDDEIVIKVIAYINESRSNIEYSHNDFLEKFKQENPDLFTKVTIKEFMKTGEVVLSKIRNPSLFPIEIDKFVIDKTLKLEKFVDMPISKINLSLKAAWISKREGMIPISRRIENRFKMARINTITPKKLENSWPEFGYRIRSKGAVATKYVIASSRLRETELKQYAPLKINDSIPELKILKHIYDNRLLISWDFEQYMNEIINVNIMSNLQHGVCKSLNINLHNVQEYLENQYERSFFRSSNGTDILNAIIKSVADFMVNSWRNIEICCDLCANEITNNLSCKDWISFRNTKYKVTKIEREINNQENLIKIKAMTFSVDMSNYQNIKEIVLPKEENIKQEDVIEDIVVHNEADTQYEKLKKFIAANKDKMNKNNYKAMINTFLNENQTSIQIVTKPLKIEHCEKKIIEPINIYFANGAVQ